MSLSEFYGQFYLTPEEKAQRLGVLVNRDDVDEAFLPYLDRLNSFPFICTTQCCTGHPKRSNPSHRNTAHIDFRTSLPFESVFWATLPIIDHDEYKASLNIYGQEMAMPRYCLWINNQSRWQEVINVLIQKFEEVQTDGTGM